MMKLKLNRQGSTISLVLVFLAAVIGTAIVAYVLVTMFEHKQDAKQAFPRVVELSEVSTDPAPWGLNFPHQFDQYKSTAGDRFYGGSSALPDSKLEEAPWLKRLYQGYAFSLDYRHARGHAYMLYDQMVTERVHQRKQAGACLHCHASPVVLYRKAGLEAMGLPADDETLAKEFNMEAVIKGFEVLSKEPYHAVLEKLTHVPDGTPLGEGKEVFEAAPIEGFNREDIPEGHFQLTEAHPVSCIDCHDPKTMKLRISRPGFIKGIAALAKSDGDVPHLPSIAKWRRGDRATDYDPNALASRQEMRTFSCAQCHVEYYCAPLDVLEFPWGHGLRHEDLERHWEEKKFPDGSDFKDYVHTETGAPVYKVQHPEFELWSQGTHARAGVSCADCHMPYERVGAMKLSNHNVRSPMENINNACQTCHNVPEQDLRDRVTGIQDRTKQIMEMAAKAMEDMLDAVKECKERGATPEQLQEIYVLQRKSMWRLDYISSENSKGFHAAQEAARCLAESIDYSRQAQTKAMQLSGQLPAMAPAAAGTAE